MGPEVFDIKQLSRFRPWAFRILEDRVASFVGIGLVGIALLAGAAPAERGLFVREQMMSGGTAEGFVTREYRIAPFARSHYEWEREMQQHLNPADARRLKSEEIDHLLRGKMITPKGTDKFLRYEETFSEGGRWRFVFPGRGVTTTDGTWVVRDNEICVSSADRNLCRAVFRDDSTGRIYLAQFNDAEVSPIEVKISSIK
jgi:hypothetical protein